MQGGEPYSFLAHLKLLGIIALNSFTYSALMYLVAMLAKTEGAWSGLGTVIGTLVGFFGGIYLPIGNFSEGIATGMKCLPVIYGAKLFRSIMTADAEAAAFDGAPAEMISEYRLALGTDLEFLGTEISDAASALILLICGIVFMAAAVLITGKAQKSDR